MAPRPGGGTAHTNAVVGVECATQTHSQPAAHTHGPGLGAGTGGVLGTEPRAPRTRAECYHCSQPRLVLHPRTLPVYLRAQPSPKATRASLSCPGDLMDRLRAPAPTDRAAIGTDTKLPRPPPAGEAFLSRACFCCWVRIRT